MGRGVSTITKERLEAVWHYANDAKPVTVRGCCYHLFTKGLIDSMAKKFTGEISRILVTARENGDIPWEWIVDETREGECVPSWANPAEFGETVLRAYRKDRWLDQDSVVEIWSEKGTVRGLLGPILRKYQIMFRVMHGYTSATAAKEIAETIEDAVDRDKSFVALYVGDWDPSGLDMSERDLPKRLDAYSNGSDFELRRIALIKDDLAGLPSFPLESKEKDTRYPWYKRTYHPTVCWELDAMNPNDLRERVENEILDYIDMEKWELAEVCERAQRESIAEYAKGMKSLKWTV